MKDSVVITWFINSYAVLCVWYDNSLLSKILNSVYDFVAAMIGTSIIGRFFAAPSKDGTYLVNSLCFKLGYKLYKLIKKPSSALRDVKGNFKSASTTYEIIKNLRYISTRFYGLVLLISGVFVAAVGYIGTGNILLAKMIMPLAFIAIGIVFIIINKLPSNLARGSGFLCFIKMFFVEQTKVDIDNKLYLNEAEYKIKNRFLGLFIGLFVGIAMLIFTPAKFIMIAGGLIVLLLTLKYVEVGLFIAVAGAPILPTMGLVGIIAICVLSLVIKLILDPKFKVRVAGFDFFVLLFMGAVLYGAMISFDFKGSLKVALVYLVFIMIYFVMTNVLNTKRKWKMFMVGFVLSAAVVAAFGIIQNYLGLTSEGGWLDVDMFSGIERRVYSTFDNPNVLGEFLILSIITGVGLMWVEKWNTKLWYALAILAMAACMMFTWSRGAWLGVMGAMFLFAVIKDKRFAILVLIGIIILPFVAGDTIMSRLGSIGNMADSSTAYRVSIWMSSLKMLKDFWISGIGLGSNTFSAFYSQYAQLGATFALHSHNTFLQIAISMGAIGVISFFALILGYFKTVYSGVISGINKSNKYMLTIALAISCGVFGYLIQGMTDNVWYNNKMFLIFWIMLGFTITALRARD